MNKNIRLIVYAVLSICVSVLLWLAMETLLNGMTLFASFRGFYILLGSVLGLIWGAMLASYDGLFTSNSSRLRKNLILGAAAGLIFGVFGLFFGQVLMGWLYESLGSQLNLSITMSAMLSRSLGWIITASFIGSVPGIISLSPRRGFSGILAACLGALIGSLLYEFVFSVLEASSFARFLGLFCIVFSMSISMAIMERILAKGYIRILNGDLRGKEYPVNQKKILAGNGETNLICLKGYEDIADKHIAFIEKRGRVTVRKLGDAVMKINDDIANSATLKRNDVISIGSVKMMYRY